MKTYFEKQDEKRRFELWERFHQKKIDKTIRILCFTILGVVLLDLVIKFCLK